MIGEIILIIPTVFIRRIIDSLLRLKLRPVWWIGFHGLHHHFFSGIFHCTSSYRIEIFLIFIGSRRVDIIKIRLHPARTSARSWLHPDICDWLMLTSWTISWISTLFISTKLQFSIISAKVRLLSIVELILIYSFVDSGIHWVLLNTLLCSIVILWCTRFTLRILLSIVGSTHSLFGLNIWLIILLATSVVFIALVTLISISSFVINSRIIGMGFRITEHALVLIKNSGIGLRISI